MCNSCRVSVLSLASLSQSCAACKPSCFTWASKATILSWQSFLGVNLMHMCMYAFFLFACALPSSGQCCSDTRPAPGGAVSSESPSSPPDCSPAPVGRTPAPQTAWSQFPELHFSVQHSHMQVISDTNTTLYITRQNCQTIKSKRALPANSRLIIQGKWHAGVSERSC